MNTTNITIVKDEEGFAPIIKKWTDAVEGLRVATAADWKTKPMSVEHHYIISTEIPVPAYAMDRIRQGHIPEGMDDRWFMYCENDVIRYFRSWLGANIFNAYFEQRGDDFCIYRIDVDTEDFSSSPNEAADALKMFIQLLFHQCDVHEKECPINIVND